MKKTYHRSCDYGAIRFEAAIDFSGEASKCNCAICMKGRFWKTRVAGSLTTRVAVKVASSKKLFTVRCQEVPPRQGEWRG